MRLQKYLARSGIASRRASEKLIEEGRVSVNGQVVSVLGSSVDETCDKVCVDGKEVSLINETETYMLNKPVGYVTTMSDPQRRPTVKDFVDKANLPGGFPVGRLDIDTSGLLLLTNDGNLAHLLSHPSHGIEKTYIAKLDKPFLEKHLKNLEAGIDIGDFITSRAEASYEFDNLHIRLTIHEGKNRQVRRMFKALGYKVVELRRVSYGSLELGDLGRGEIRRLTSKEIDNLTKEVLKV